MNYLSSISYRLRTLITSLFLGLKVFYGQPFQNLVPNGSFESYSLCPTAGGQIYYASPWLGPKINSTDYNHSCSSIMNVPHYGGISHPYPYYLNAFEGNSYIGLWYYSPGNFREYAQVELVDTLLNGTCYYVEFYAANSQGVPFAANNLAASLSSLSYPTNFPNQNALLTIPSHITNYGNKIIADTVKWQKIAGLYQAYGIEKYLLIGNFSSNSQTDTLRLYAIGTGPYLSADASYAFIDAVSVYSINPNGILPWTYRDTSVFIGDSVYIGNKMGGIGFHPQWFDISGNYISTNAGIYVKPIATSSYVVNYTVCGVTRSDTVVVTVNENVVIPEQQLWMNDLKIFPNPANTFITLSFNLNQAIKFNSLRIFNQLGQLMREEEITFKDKAATLKIDDLMDGVYFLELKGWDSFNIKKRFVISN